MCYGIVVLVVVETLGKLVEYMQPVGILRTTLGDISFQFERKLQERISGSFCR